MSIDIDEWIHKMQHIHTTEDDSTLERKGILTHVTTWMEP